VSAIKASLGAVLIDLPILSRVLTIKTPIQVVVTIKKGLMIVERP
jgi:hypothetical protein